MIQYYRQLIYEIGVLPAEKGKSIDNAHMNTNRKRGFKTTRVDHFKYRTRYFTDSGVIGSRKLVQENYQRFRNCFDTKKEKVPVSIKGLDGLFSLKRLANSIL